MRDVDSRYQKLRSVEGVCLASSLKRGDTDDN